MVLNLYELVFDGLNSLANVFPSFDLSKFHALLYLLAVANMPVVAYMSLSTLTSVFLSGSNTIPTTS